MEMEMEMEIRNRSDINIEWTEKWIGQNEIIIGLVLYNCAHKTTISIEWPFVELVSVCLYSYGSMELSSQIVQSQTLFAIINLMKRKEKEAG